MKLEKHLVEKPWGRTDIPPAFGDFGGRQIGEIWYQAADERPLPILVKWLFTSDKLSVQVHPDDMQASLRGRASGKEECWYVTHAEPGAVLGIGTKQTLDADELRAVSLSGEIEQLMDWKPVSPGDYFYIPAGTVHAIGAGVTLVEVQQFADITYRLYDYGRLDKGQPRELHLDDGVAVSDARPYADPRSGKASGSMQLVDGPHFRLWLVDDEAGLADIPENGERWVVPLQGSVRISGDRADVGDCVLASGGAPLQLGDESRMLIATI